MAVVTGRIVKPSGTARGAANKTRVRFRLVDSTGAQVTQAWDTSTSDRLIVGYEDFELDTEGDYSVTLPGNVDIEPSGTRWSRVTLVDGQEGPARSLVVPTGAGTYSERAILDEAPGALPTPDPTNELDYAEISADTSALSVNGLAVSAVPLLVVDVPDIARPAYLSGSLRMTCNTANADIYVAFGPVGGTINDVRGPYWCNIGATAGTSQATAAPCHRLAAHSPGTWQAFVGSNASVTITVKGAAQGLSWVRALSA